MLYFSRSCGGVQYLRENINNLFVGLLEGTD